MTSAGAMVLRHPGAEKRFSLVEARFFPMKTHFCRPLASLKRVMRATGLIRGAANGAFTRARAPRFRARRGRSGTSWTEGPRVCCAAMKMIVRWLLLAAALLLVAHLY